MISVENAIALERSGDLADARAALLSRWEAGLRDEETLLRLAFLEWWAACEPSFLTGLGSRDGEDSIYPDVVDALLAVAQVSSRSLACVGLMSRLFPWACGRADRDWAALGRDLTVWSLQAGGVACSEFDDDSELGRYFRHQFDNLSAPES